MFIVDRRLNPGSKSLENRQRFLRRAKALVQGAVKKTSEGRDIKDVLEGGEVSIPLDGMHEPRFRTEGGTRDRVLPGNKKFVEGDIIERPKGGGGRGSQPGEGDSEDDFRFVLSRDEFVNLFLDDLELPDLAKRKLADAESEGLQRAGYSTSGSPANISVKRTVQLALARRIALRRPRPEAIAELEVELETCSDEARRIELLAEIEALKSKAKRIPFIDPIDIRYRRFDSVPKPVAQAVMFCLMDVSGSMTENLKDLARRFFGFLYIFLIRNYKRLDLVFIRHTDEAEEVTEEVFFKDRLNGGTVVLSVLDKMSEIIAERYNPVDWNIYGCQASDGDATSSDSVNSAFHLESQLLDLCQFFAYVEVTESKAHASSHLWNAYGEIEADNFAMKMVRERREIPHVFRELFEKGEKRRRVA